MKCLPISRYRGTRRGSEAEELTETRTSITRDVMKAPPLTGEKAPLMRKQASASVPARAFCVMNSLVAYTLRREIQHVCQGYLGKSHSLVCGSVAFYYLPQSLKSNSISSLPPWASVSAARALDGAAMPPYGWKRL